MAKDIVPELYERMLGEFNSLVENSKKVQAFNKRLEAGTASTDSVSLYASELGDLLGQAIGATLTEEALPDGKLYWNIAERTVLKLLEEVHKMVNVAATTVQSIEDKKQGIGLKVIEPPFPMERGKALINKAVDISLGEGFVNGTN